MVASTSEARRLIEGGGLEIAGEKVRELKLDLSSKFTVKAGQDLVVKAGKKKFLKLKVK